jgi:hypothetical protein
MVERRKSRAFNPHYESPSQGVLAGFETPFERELNSENRWVVLAHLIPWDELACIYWKHVGVSSTGREGLNPRIVIGSLIIKYLCHLDDRETVDQISENIYMQYFLGYSGFVNEKPFDASLFVDIRKRLGIEVIQAMNEKIIRLKTQMDKGKDSPVSSKGDGEPQENGESGTTEKTTPENRGWLLMASTSCSSHRQRQIAGEGRIWCQDTSIPC